jgi:hypothetical protein
MNPLLIWTARLLGVPRRPRRQHFIVRSREGFAFEIVATVRKALAMQRFALQRSARSLGELPGFTRRGDMPRKQVEVKRTT